ncbi:MAG: YqaA family protein [Lutimaribacter sp.]|jgi:membrane protein YqaA with SNARE-associated domain
MSGALTGLFLAAFVAATLLPAQSEALLAYLVVQSAYSVALLVAVATLGNVLGSCVNWGLGRFFRQYRDARWFPVSARHQARAETIYRRYGRASLLLSWVPIIGDPITCVAGLLGEDLRVFVVIVTLAKAGRYCVVAGITLAAI